MRYYHKHNVVCVGTVTAVYLTQSPLQKVKKQINVFLVDSQWPMHWHNY
ncbi:Uncharacterised protein [Acinetobacter baumannii]|nr:Uncharacterised protein [Acinetobacter baumannii]